MMGRYSLQANFSGSEHNVHISRYGTPSVGNSIVHVAKLTIVKYGQIRWTIFLHRKQDSNSFCYMPCIVSSCVEAL